MKSPFGNIGKALGKVFNKGTIGGVLGGVKTGAKILSDPLAGAALTAAIGPEASIPIIAGANVVSRSNLL